jgi:hypothetical protein
MTHPDERVRDLLTQLAGRADADLVPERVNAVHRRVRRARTVRRAAAAGALTVALAAGVGVRTGDLPWRRAQVPDPARPVPTPTASLAVDVRQDDQATDTVPNRQAPAAQAVLVIRIHGRVPARPVTEVSASGREHLLGLRIAESGGYEGTSAEPADCRPGAPLVEVDDEFSHVLHVDRPGRNLVTVIVTACGPVGTVSRTITVDARPGGVP